ncbi:uncharacterized protein LOC128548637 [Mercenaria mercenaria]|uniref:uncharacterized protein LOC128548637 n=1 Tax=Mercenaria mercenaria TaxID=6596 RepID=UPI00234E6209|nr:uncharacterized protein LOC128548637 [Mercenaria mercenaria]
MRDNLLFFGFDELSTAESRRSENCANTVLDYCKNTLKIVDPESRIKIERAHRLGNKYDSTKSRPIVVKFNHYPDKLLIKQKASDYAKSLSSQPKIRVSEQFPKTIQDRRRLLIPAMIKAKNDGKTAYLSYDKLFINNRMYTVDNVSTSGYS